MINLSFRYRYRKVILIVTLIFITIVSATGVFVCKYKLKKDDKNNSKVLISNKKQEENTTDNELEIKDDATTKEYKVDIKGEIINPGIYSLKVGSRVDDVIKQAGGLKDTADTSVINLSKKIQDEMVIIIYSKSQVQDFSKTKETETKVITSCITPDESEVIKNDACIETDTPSDSNKDQSTEKISINSADKNTLMTLTGIGEGKALNIIKYREQNGPFKSIEELKNVDGIGESIYDKIKENITL